MQVIITGTHRAALPRALLVSQHGHVFRYTSVGGKTSSKRRRICERPQAKNRRRSTQGIVFPVEERVRQPTSIEKPGWVSDLEEDAKEDEEIAQLIEGTNGDPEAIRRRMNNSMAAKRDEILEETSGEEGQMQVEFREVNPFDLWIWFDLYRPPSGREADLLEEVLASWFMLGRLGAYNAQNLQVFQQATDDISYLDYDADECDTELQSFFHDMSQMELRENWARCWVNLGTSDELALDMLINALANFSRENLGIRKLYIGGENEDWEIPKQELPKATMNPMAGPGAVDDIDY